MAKTPYLSFFPTLCRMFLNGESLQKVRQYHCFLSNTHHFSLHQSLKEEHQILVCRPVCGFLLRENILTGLFDSCSLGFCVNPGIDLCRTAVCVPEKIANVNQVDPRPYHMYCLAMAEHVRSDIEIRFKLRIVFCFINVFVYYFGLKN